MYVARISTCISHVGYLHALVMYVARISTCISHVGYLHALVMYMYVDHKTHRMRKRVNPDM